MNDPVLSPHYLYDARREEERVRRLQRLLRTISHIGGDPALNAAENGVYDDGTRAAVRAFQRKFGLPVTGRVDLRTWDLLRQVWELHREERERPGPIRPFPEPERRIVPGEYSDLTAVLQLMLSALRLHVDSIGALPLSGHYDNATTDAVREFQRISRLPETGEVDAATWNRLAAEYSRIARESQ